MLGHPSHVRSGSGSPQFRRVWRETCAPNDIQLARLRRIYAGSQKRNGESTTKAGPEQKKEAFQEITWQLGGVQSEGSSLPLFRAHRRHFHMAQQSCTSSIERVSCPFFYVCFVVLSSFNFPSSSFFPSKDTAYFMSLVVNYIYSYTQVKLC
jgi:hypothetical protein